MRHHFKKEKKKIRQTSGITNRSVKTNVKQKDDECEINVITQA